MDIQTKVCERCDAHYGPRPAEDPKAFARRRYCSRPCFNYARCERTRQFVARLERGPATPEQLALDIYEVGEGASERQRNAARVRVRSMMQRVRWWVEKELGGQVIFDRKRGEYRIVMTAGVSA